MIIAAGLALWTAAGLAVWWQAFPIRSTAALGAIRAAMTQGAFDPGALLETWGEAVPTWMLLAGVLSVAARAGAEGRLWLRVRAGAGDGIPLRIALGLGLGGTALLGAGLTGLLFAPPGWVIYAVLGTAGGAGLGTWAFGRKARRRAAPPDPGPRPGRLTRYTIGAAGLVAAAGVFGPETGWDAMMYHLRLPMMWEAAHKVRDIPHDFYATYPHLAESLYAGCRLVGGDALARWLEASLAVALAVVAGELAGRLGGSARLAAAVIFASPVVLALVPRAYTDLHLALFGSLALALAARGAWMPAAMLAGFALGTKYVGVFVLPAVAAIAMSRRSAVIGPLRWAIGSALFAAPWYLRNALWRGNPVEPFLAGWFGTGATLPESVIPFFERAGGLAALAADLPRRLGALLLDPGHLQSPLSPAVLLWLPLLWWPRHHAGGFGSALRAGALAWLAGWLLLAPDARFALAAVPALAALAAAGFTRWADLRSPERSPSDSRWVTGTGSFSRPARRFIIAAPLLAGALYSASRELIALDPLSLPLGRGSAAGRLTRGLVPPPFAHLAARAVQARVPMNGRVLVVSHFITYHAGRECLADWHTGRSKLAGLLNGSRTPEDVAKAFRRERIGWLLFTGPGCESYLGLPGYYNAPADAWTAFREYLASRSRVVWQTDGYALLELDGPPGSPRRRPGPVPYLPGLETATFAAADRAARGGEAQAALAAYRAAPGVLEGVGSTYLRRAEALISLRRFGEAERDLARALATGLDTPRLRERRARVLLSLGRPRDALIEIDRAADMLPGDAAIEVLRSAIRTAIRRPTGSSSSS